MLHVAFTDAGGVITGYAVQNLSGAANAYSGMLFYDQNGALGQFQGFNNTTHEYRINNIASGGTINFLIGSSSKFKVATNGNIGLGVASPASKLDVAGDVNLTGVLKMSGSPVLQLPGTQNIGLGVGAFASNTTGTENTAVGPANYDELYQHFGVRGLPTVIVLDARGREVARETRFVPAGQMAALLRRADERTSER